jgi:hypothetical protein
MADPVDVDVDYSWEGDERLYAVSLSTDTWLAVIHIPPEDAIKLNDVASRSWDDGSLRIGESAAAAAWWSVGDDNETVMILIGHDDETWDISIAIPAATIPDIVAAIAALDAP